MTQRKMNGITWMNSLFYSGPAISPNSVQFSLAVFRRQPLTVRNQLGSPNARVTWGRDPQADVFPLDSQDTNLNVGANSDALPCFAAQDQHEFGSEYGKCLSHRSLRVATVVPTVATEKRDVRKAWEHRELSFVEVARANGGKSKAATACAAKCDFRVAQAGRNRAAFGKNLGRQGKQGPTMAKRGTPAWTGSGRGRDRYGIRHGRGLSPNE